MKEIKIRYLLNFIIYFLIVFVPYYFIGFNEIVDVTLLSIISGFFGLSFVYYKKKKKDTFWLYAFYWSLYLWTILLLIGQLFIHRFESFFENFRIG